RSVEGALQRSKARQEAIYGKIDASRLGRWPERRQPGVHRGHVQRRGLPQEVGQQPAEPCVQALERRLRARAVEPVDPLAQRRDESLVGGSQLLQTGRGYAEVERYEHRIEARQQRGLRTRVARGERKLGREVDPYAG